MAAPGTAYDDPVLGRDPQPAHMDDYVDTSADNGGVHLNSGIPNRAFHLAATAIGGSSAEGAGAIWYAALTGGGSGPGPTSPGSRRPPSRRPASTPRRCATPGRRSGSRRPRRPPHPVSRPRPTESSTRRVAVRRSGGFLGRTTAGEVDLDRGDLRAGELAALVDRVDLATVAGGVPKPDMYVYDFDLCGSRATVPEHHLTHDLRRIADLVLEPDADGIVRDLGPA